MTLRRYFDERINRLLGFFRISFKVCERTFCATTTFKVRGNFIPSSSSTLSSTPSTPSSKSPLSLLMTPLTTSAPSFFKFSRSRWDFADLSVASCSCSNLFLRKHSSQDKYLIFQNMTYLFANLYCLLYSLFVKKLWRQDKS